MPNKKAAIKHLRQTIKRTASNVIVIKNIKDIVKQGKKAIADNTINEKAHDLMYSLQKAVDKAVKSGILKANTANRRKARFAAMLKKANVKIDQLKSKKVKQDNTKKSA